MADTTELAGLLAHAEWLRTLARALVGPAAADDAVQDTYVAALRSPPDPALPARPWLARVLRNATRMAHRASTRRAHREDAFATLGASIGADDVVARAETFRTLVELVLGLGEPYRTVLVRHYFDGDPLAAIARRDGVPEATVRGRHKHALEQLRTQLDARARGDRGAWFAAFAPLAAPPAHTTSIGVLVMNKILIGSVVAIATAGAVWWLYPHASDRPAGSTAVATPAGATHATEPDPALGSAASAAPAQHVRQVASAERQRLADRIATAQAIRARRNQPATAPPPSDQTLPSSPAGSAHEGDMDKDVIRGAMHEVLPFLADCYGAARGTTLAADHLAIHAKLEFTGDPDIGTIVDARQLVDDDGKPLPAKLDDCLRGTLQTLELPPLGDGQTIDVDYPLRFDDGSDGSGS
ncbi:MAG: sigma-70 family RNA polymerase sigma factor [Kofleriaceae bacterium]